MLRLIAVVAALSTLAACEESDPCNEIGAFVASQELVERRLKSPSTAEFPRINAEGVRVAELEECRFMVKAYVDSQNGFGAQIRSVYLAELKYFRDGEYWEALSIDIN